MHCRPRPWLLHYYSPVCHFLGFHGLARRGDHLGVPRRAVAKDSFRTWGGPGASAWVALGRGALPVVGCAGMRLRWHGKRRLSGVHLVSLIAALGITQPTGGSVRLGSPRQRESVRSPQKWGADALVREAVHPAVVCAKVPIWRGVRNIRGAANRVTFRRARLAPKWAKKKKH